MTRTFENSGSEKEFLDIYQREEMDKYVKPSVTVDSVIFRYYEGRVPVSYTHLDVYKRQYLVVRLD